MSKGTTTAIAVASSLGFCLVLIFLMYAAAPWLDRAEIPFFGSRLRDTVWFGSIGVASAFATVRFIQGRRWAYWSAIAVTAIILVLAFVFVYWALNPKSDYEAMETGFGFFIGLLLLAPGIVAGVLLNPPSVRRRFLL